MVIQKGQHVTQQTGKSCQQATEAQSAQNVYGWAKEGNSKKQLSLNSDRDNMTIEVATS